MALQRAPSSTPKGSMKRSSFGIWRRWNVSIRSRASVKAARLILDKARSGALPDPFTVRDAHRPRWSGLTENEIVADAVDLLTAHGWLTEATVETGGRRTAVYSLTEGARRG